MSRARCSRCQTTLRFCPSCGTAFTSPRETPAKGGHPSLTLHTTTAAAAAATGSRDESDNGTHSTWMRHLPPRAVSAYEVYQAEQLHAFNGNNCAARSAKQDETCQSANSGRSFSLPQAQFAASAIPFTTQQPQPGDQRAVAIAWLRLNPSAKQHYEDLAQKWASDLQRKACEEKESASGVPIIPKTLSKVASSNALHRSSLEMLIEEASAAISPAARTTNQGAPKPTLRAASTKKGSRDSNTCTRGRGRVKTSFHLFREEMKGRKWTVVEAAAVWRQMSAEEKSRYDAAAASYRTGALCSPHLPAPLEHTFNVILSQPTSGGTQTSTDRDRAA